MDSFSSEFSDGQFPALSMSLVSYGSDLETSVDDSTPNLKMKTIHSPSDTDTVIGDDCCAPEETIIEPLCKRVQQLSCTGLSEKKKVEVEKALSDAAAAKKEYLETMEVFRALQSVVSSDKLPQPTKEIVQKVLQREELRDYVSAGLLGLKEEHLHAYCPQQLSETDQKIVRLAVESQLIQNARELKHLDSSKQEILTKLSSNAAGNTRIKVESDYTGRMSSLRAELNNELDRYYKHLTTLDSLLESIIQMRTIEISENCLKVISGFEAKGQLLKQKARLITTQIESAIYTEDANIVAAMQRLEKDLDLLYTEIEAELSKSNGLLAAYNRVQGPEYNNILQEYHNVVKRLKSAKYVLEEAKNWS